jgi:integrase
VRTTKVYTHVFTGTVSAAVSHLRLWLIKLTLTASEDATKVGGGRHLSPKRERLQTHTRLRHTFGTRLADAGLDVVKIKELMGHASIVTTMRYIHATD